MCFHHQPLNHLCLAIITIISRWDLQEGICWYVPRGAATVPPSGSREPQLQLSEGEPAAQLAQEGLLTITTIAAKHEIVDDEPKYEQKYKHSQQPQQRQDQREKDNAFPVIAGNWPSAFITLSV